MNTAITVVCCLIPCIGIVLGLIFLQKSKGKKTEGTEISGPSAKLLKAVGVRIVATAAGLLTLTVLALAFVPMETPKSRLGALALLVTVQYGAAIALIFSANGMLRKDQEQRKKIRDEENE